MPPELPRPHLLPQNIKLRHLRGISLRNLTVVRPIGRAIDDAAINTSPKVDRPLHHTRSSESLRAPLVRRQSISLTTTVSGINQKELAFAIESKVADVFFSLHCDSQAEPVYISEVGERAANFDFSFFGLHELHPAIARSPLVTVRVWSRRLDVWNLLIEDEVDLRYLNFLGRLDDHHFPSNTILFHLLHGVYAFGLAAGKQASPKQGPPLATSSYNALMRLATLDSSIQDALATQSILARQINEILEKHPSTTAKVSEAKDRSQIAQRYLTQQWRLVDATEKRRDRLRASITARRDAMAQGRQSQSRAIADVENAQGKLAASKELLQTTKDKIRGQRRRICEDLTSIFPITPHASQRPLAFQICGLPLPNTSYDPAGLNPIAADEDVISAALGHVAWLVHHLQLYLSVPLPYPVNPLGSRSSIRDDISNLAENAPRQYPLYIPRGGSSAQFRFDYGWFLLNKDVEALCNAQRLKVVDIRHSLPNLKYLLYVCAAGTDELPRRKKGGIRGLWTSRLGSQGVRLGDADTVGSDASDSGREARPLPIKNARQVHKNDLDSAGTGSPSSLPTTLSLPFSSGDTKLKLRTKGLRENVPTP